MQKTHVLGMSLAVVGALLLFLLGSLVYTHDGLDDPYIAYRYSRNLARGDGLVWNAGEPPVEGYTNFSWVVLHAPLIGAGISPLLISKLLSLAAGAAVILLIFSPLNRAVHSGVWRTVLALSIAGCPMMLFYGQSGMENFFFTALAFAAILFWANSRVVAPGNAYRAASSAVFAVAGMTRPEGAFLFGIIWLLELWQLRTKPAGETLRNLVALSVPFALIWLPYFLWRWHYYGYLFPNTFYAKHTGNRLGNLPLGFAYTSEAFAIYLLAPCALMIGMAMALRVKRTADETPPRDDWKKIVGPFVLLTIVYLLYIVWVGGDDTSAFPSYRLLMPILPVIWLCLAASCQAITASATSAGQILAGFVVLLLCVTAWMPDGFKLVKWANPEIRTTRSNSDSLKSIWDKINHFGEETPGDLAQWVKQNTKPGDLIAMPWVGRVAYYADRPALDTLGLNDFHIAHISSPQQRGIDVKMDPEYVLSRHPDLIFVNVGKCYWNGTCTFEEAGGWKLGDKRMIELLKDGKEYSFVPAAPTNICVFQRRK